jgi:transposase
MAIRYGERRQRMLLPSCIEEYVGEQDPVRVYDAFVEEMDLEELGIEIEENRVGNSEYDPRAMLKLLIYGYSYGVRSSRKLEREINHNLSFMWLMGGLKPDHKTISEFRRRNKEVIKKVLKRSVRMCIEFELVSGNILFVDGTKIRANAGRSNNHTKKYYEEQLVKINKMIDDLMKECEEIDSKEEGEESYVKIQEELNNQKSLKEKMKGFIERIEREGRKTVNSTDPESALMRSVQGSHASYNVQSVVDDKCGLIVHGDVVVDTSDINQFARQIEGAEDTIGKKCEVGCADAGYADTEELGKIEGREEKTTVIVPSQRGVRQKCW